MKEDNKNNSSLVPVNSVELVRLEKSINITEKILKKQEDRLSILSWDILFEHRDFFNRFFSTFFSFSEEKLIDFYKKLELGHEFTNPSDHEPLGVGQALYGLQYNKNISWTTSLIELYSEKPNDFLDFYYLKNFTELPFDIKSQVDAHLGYEQYQFMYPCDVGRPGYEEVDYLLEKGEISEEDAENMMSYEPDENINTYYNNIFNKETFSSKEIMEIIDKYELDFFCNNSFVSKLENKIIEDIPDFNLTKFYDQIVHKFNT